MTFEGVHVRRRRECRREAAAAAVARLVLVSGIGADPHSELSLHSGSRTRQRMVRQVFPGATIVRPGVCRVRAMLCLARLQTSRGSSGTAANRRRLYPAAASFCGRLAEAIASLLSGPGTVGRTAELAGPGVYTLRELVSMTLRLMRNRRLLIPVPFPWQRSRRDCSSSCRAHH